MDADEEEEGAPGKKGVCLHPWPQNGRENKPLRDMKEGTNENARSMEFVLGGAVWVQAEIKCHTIPILLYPLQNPASLVCDTANAI